MAGSRTAEVYEALKEELLNGDHAPGSKLAIEALALRFGVSPGAVRESLSRLTSDRLVEALPQRGFLVAPISQDDLTDLTEVRIDIETRCLRRSIERGTLEWEARLLSTWHQVSHVGDSPQGRAHPDWPRLHAQLHDDLVAACGSPWWLRLREVLYMQAERYRRLILPRAQAARDINAEHRAIVERTLARDADAAVAALADHMQRTAQDLLEAGPRGFERRMPRGAAMGKGITDGAKG
ncbi:GntR family transcriptional regulator [Neotabrizicola shimadae]|uniref:FCD domain-containing protein n=1 Tax=Neotabrizicola shimadae TaxID=2807096 RepID=A0A8G0ZT09_9RHOB|nr:FCD domain-containing protein [Neotabrizicola shimadae]QYZ69573.1 FCD domain-containing protein [Neotabrizicola shimadae]